MKKEIPILFSGPMVLANLEGRKTKTRRTKDLELINKEPSNWEFITEDSPFKQNDIFWFEKEDQRIAIKCPYSPGNILWVRENFRVNSWVPDDGELNFRYEADGAVSPYMMVDTEDSECEIFNKYWEQSCDDLLKAGYEVNDEERFVDYDYKALRLRPNIFLPKVAARIWLQVENVRVERLRDISGEDVLAEGVGEKHRSGAKSMTTAGIDYRHWVANQKLKFQKLWGKINGSESWAANPWVFVISFKVLSTTGKPDLQTT